MAISGTSEEANVTAKVRCRTSRPSNKFDRGSKTVSCISAFLSKTIRGRQRDSNLASTLCYTTSLSKPRVRKKTYGRSSDTPQARTQAGAKEQKRRLAEGPLETANTPNQTATPVVECIIAVYHANVTSRNTYLVNHFTTPPFPPSPSTWPQGPGG